MRLSAGLPNNSSVHAQEGTRAHALAELCLTKNVDPEVYLGIDLEGGVVGEEMVDHVRPFVDYCKSLVNGSTDHWIEKRFNLAALQPPAPMFGTADFVAYDAALKTLHVVDLKYGQGVVVEVTGNPQLRYYGLGAALSMPLGTQIDQVHITIVQPRTAHGDGPIRTEVIDYIDLVGWSSELLEAARATTAPDAALNPGSHCRWCPASGQCPAQRERAQLVAQSDFAVTPIMPPVPSLIPDEQFFEMFGKIHILDDWIKAMRAHAQAKLDRGEEVPGFKLVAKRASRKWNDAQATAAWLIARGNTPDEIYEPADLKSVAQIEKLVGKKALPAEQSFKHSSGLSMVPSTDARPAVLRSAGDEFGILPGSTPTATREQVEE